MKQEISTKAIWRSPIPECGGENVTILVLLADSRQLPIRTLLAPVQELLKFRKLQQINDKCNNVGRLYKFYIAAAHLSLKFYTGS